MDIEMYYRPKGSAMRLQLALNVPDLDEAINFYTQLFATEPKKVKPGYANWEIATPPLKLVLFENTKAAPGSINHLGVETETAEQVVAAESRLRNTGLETTGINDTICCFAEKVETWVNGPDGTRWEWYVKQADHETQLDNVLIGATDGAGCQTSGTCCS